MSDRRESAVERGTVWYPADFSRGGLVAALPDDLEPRMLEPGQPAAFSADEAGVLLLDGPIDDLDAALLEAARRAMVPAVVLSESAEAAPVARGFVSLTLPVGAATLASVLHAACEQARVTREAKETTRQLEELNAIGVRLSGERDTKLLLELILTKARDITRSDAGSIYLVETASDGSRRLRFELAQNDSVPVEFNAVALPLSQESLAGHVALTGEVLAVADAYALAPDGPYRFNPEVDALAGYRTKSLLVLPMRTPGGEIIGVLALINCKRESGRPFASTAAIEREALSYPEAFCNLAASLASQAAVALSNSNLFRELTRRQGRLEALVEVSQRVTRLWPPATVQRRIADLYGSLLQADAVAFHLVDEGRLLRVEVRGEDMATLLPAEIALGKGPIGRVAATGEPLAIMDLAGPGWLDPAEQESAVRLGMRGGLAVPVHAGDRLVGVLTALTSQAAAFSEDDVAVASTFAAQAGIAIENSRLYAELERALEGVQRSQDQLVQVERLRALGEMAAGVAHDFNNLLAVVMLRTELLLARNQAPAVAESLTMIRQAAHDGAQTVRRIQEFTRTRSTRPFGRVDMLQVLREVVELARPRWRDQAQSRGVTYDVRIEGGQVPLVAGTVEELREALLNLLNNALDAMPAGGTFTFRSAAEGDRVVIHAADGGCGMSEETRRRVFEPFFTTKGAQGNGLGLAVVWGIIARHGGEISVDSVLGRGTTFTLRLPVPAVLPADPGAEDGSQLPRGKRVLVVEDNAEILRSLGDLLRDNGCLVIEASSGMSALARMEAETVDLVLTDLAMPGVSGWAVASACRERCPGTPVGLITGFGDRLEPDKLEQHGIRFVVAKPFSSEDLLRAVAAALRGPSPARA
ncbi:MAG TPA: GAF domain-containing protein [Methylomirabilota bacterium]|jgi:signal transduction histidine kinase/ActR/RegA family two-component response regulator